MPSSARSQTPDDGNHQRPLDDEAAADELFKNCTCDLVNVYPSCEHLSRHKAAPCLSDEQRIGPPAFLNPRGEA